MEFKRTNSSRGPLSGTTPMRSNTPVKKSSSARGSASVTPTKNSAPPMPLTTVCTKELPWEPFWSRLTSSVAASYARWAAERQGRPAHTPRRSTSRSGETGTIKTFGDFVSHYHLLEKDPFSASVAAVYDAVQQQCQLWTEEEERHLEAWRSAARPLHIPPDSAFQSTVTTHAGRVVPDSAAHQALHRLLPVKERSTAARAALNRLDEIVLCQTGERLLRWALQTLEREIVALGGQSLEESLRLLDRYGSGLTLSPEVRGVLLFISSVDVCPATLAFLKEANHSERIRVLSHPTNPQTSRRRTRAITKKSKLNSDTRREGGNTVVDILFRCPLL
ncbi:hypothetical protein AGDE_14844 [Angomonas deanei]|nr:hypothetical protein AGDE_14844 [Angomonas deanei]|eukprot:EPY20128.1 hypothetical protein AGDE_14844 [Angomonas deanei]